MPKSSDENKRAITGYAKKVTHCAMAVPDSNVVQLRMISFLKLSFGMADILLKNKAVCYSSP